MRKNKHFIQLKLFLYAVVAIALLLMPKDFFDDGGQSICLSVLLFDMQCYGCGMTRACMHLIHFVFYNKLSLLVLPLLSLFFINDIYQSLIILKKK